MLDKYQAGQAICVGMMLAGLVGIVGAFLSGAAH